MFLEKAADTVFIVIGPRPGGFGGAGIDERGRFVPLGETEGGNAEEENGWKEAML